MTTIEVTTRVAFSPHAIERYRERAFPAADHSLAARHLDCLAPNGTITARPPAWFAERALQKSELYLVVGDLVFPLVWLSDEAERWLAKTCVARGGISKPARERRNAIRHARPKRGRRP